MSKIELITGVHAEVDYRRGSAVASSLDTIRLVANQCVYCCRRTDRYTATWRDGKPWNAIPCCDECHDNLRVLPAKDNIIEIIQR